MWLDRAQVWRDGSRRFRPQLSRHEDHPSVHLEERAQCINSHVSSFTISRSQECLVEVFCMWSCFSACPRSSNPALPEQSRFFDWNILELVYVPPFQHVAPRLSKFLQRSDDTWPSGGSYSARGFCSCPHAQQTNWPRLPVAEDSGHDPATRAWKENFQPEDRYGPVWCFRLAHLA